MKRTERKKVSKLQSLTGLEPSVVRKLLSRNAWDHKRAFMVFRAALENYRTRGGKDRGQSSVL